MILIPSLELWQGKVVRMIDRDKPEVLSEDPVREARQLQKDGALFFHLTDLNAARNEGNNDAVLRAFTEALIPFQVGGGIRTAERAGELLALGADAIIMGTLFYQDPAIATDLVAQFGNRVIAALDLAGGGVRINVRSEASGHDIGTALEVLAKTGVRTIIYHRIDDTDQGPDVEGLGKVLAAEGFTVHTHCAIQKSQDLQSLLEMHEERGLAGVVIHHALAEQSFNLHRALQAI